MHFTKIRENRESESSQILLRYIMQKMPLLIRKAFRQQFCLWLGITPQMGELCTYDSHSGSIGLNSNYRLATHCPGL